MTVEFLEPNLSLLREEYVLIQAWKKTSSYIRYHNWYSDTLELDHTAINLKDFLARVAEQLENPSQWNNDPLRIVPAPKTQQWHVNSKTNSWEPIEKGKSAVKIRPLAHVSLKDQVVATAVMMCLANRIETIQGDPRDSIADVESRKTVTSYGNRLFCDNDGRSLKHRWGSSKLYRAYFQDYQRFLSRPEIVANGIEPREGSKVVIVHSDLKQFYDRVSPALLRQKLGAIRKPNDDPAFFEFANRLLNWEWDKKDSIEVSGYAVQAGLSDFSRIALPQGLVASGFFANATLLDFDTGLCDSISEEIAPDIILEDVCRYVDDLRLVLKVNSNIPLSEIEVYITDWLQALLDKYSEGLQIANDKTRAAAFRGDERPLVHQSRKMQRIQSAISGGFDAIGGEEILDAVQGLIRSQERYSEQRVAEQGWSFSPIPDVRDATVARFAAARFRSTFRSLRPLLAGREESIKMEDGTPGNALTDRSQTARSRSELDDEARAFALGLVENWVEDPSNVRLLRVAVDLWPAPDLLKKILELLRPFTEKGGRRKAPRRIAWYCLSELFRAGALETGFVEDGETFPDGVDLAAYRKLLYQEARRLIALTSISLPWYLKQQIYLYLAASDQKESLTIRKGRSPETKHYRQLIRYLKGEADQLTGTDYASLAVLSRRSFCNKEAAIQLASYFINTRRLELIAERDPSFALEILQTLRDLTADISPRLRDDLCLERSVRGQGQLTLADVVLQDGRNNSLRNEVSILNFAAKFLEQYPQFNGIEVITPSDVQLQLSNINEGISIIDSIKITASRVSPRGSMYCPPKWCSENERWRFQLGYLLRFILTASQDFTRILKPIHWKEGTATYRTPENHWFQRLYGLINNHSSFGDDWLPISDWIERLLSSLLSWPGCFNTTNFEWVREGYEVTRKEIEHRRDTYYKGKPYLSNVLMLQQSAPRIDSRSRTRPLRVCVVQTVIPTPTDFNDAFASSDLTLSSPAIRNRHRNHLSAALAAIERMLDLRETHKGREGRLDWLILPELSVHPRDVNTHLVPFARAHKTIILAGLTYEEITVGQPLVNSALWVIPVRSSAHGLNIEIRRQGKYFLAPEEEAFNTSGILVRGYRPCQWLIGYEWSIRQEDRPLWLTASICYDATDLNLASQLRDLSDVFAIPALNRDVNTFDQMALALHYHMYQMVIVANNGTFGGSNAYAPYHGQFERQVFHLHGQPQASVAFLEIDRISDFIDRVDNAKDEITSTTPPTLRKWKYPPAGM